MMFGKSFQFARIFDFDGASFLHELAILVKEIDSFLSVIPKCGILILFSVTVSTRHLQLINIDEKRHTSEGKKRRSTEKRELRSKASSSKNEKEYHDS